ncbi:hypothetical protein [Kineococcus rhizosphaerae]|uniref:DNA-directed RNA polymerase specialized sigma24 family protein n=1 Tax=Kineococcus rhizosphaerae TaxID=559628 RepID=A0A2T0QNA8_9ACTN|nr:hypothetical protein [Kineococcus rhizosphaerae]PRY06087.1 hypothetical protein CLV37_1352 [Kineococcus rhizosphaerae]
MPPEDHDTHPPRLASPWFENSRAGDLDFIRSRFSGLRWAYVAAVERLVDEVLGLPDPAVDPDRHAEALQDPTVRRLRYTAALRLVRLFPTDVEPVFVTEARRAGASWTEVGDAVDVSRQAARERWLHLDVPKGPPVKPPRVRDLFADLGGVSTRRISQEPPAGGVDEDSDVDLVEDLDVEEGSEEASTP